jgi:hypothetical protein
MNKNYIKCIGCQYRSNFGVISNMYFCSFGHKDNTISLVNDSYICPLSNRPMFIDSFICNLPKNQDMSCAAEPAKPFTMQEFSETVADIELMEKTNEMIDLKDKHIEALAALYVAKYGLNVELVSEVRENQVVFYFREKKEND